MKKGPFIETHHVSGVIKSMRLPDYARGVFLHAPTKSAIKKAIKKQHITVNGIVASTATLIKGGETIELCIPKDTSHKKKLILPLTVLFEDEYLAAIHKPAGILVSGNGFKTIDHALEQNLMWSALPDATTPQPIHRLDYATTGILLVGKTISSIHALNLLFERKEIVKIYYAITVGEMDSEGKLNAPIDGKPAKSSYSVEASVPSPRFGTLNLVKLHPETGRRHQLRKHLSGIGNPVLGDKDYGLEELILKGKGMYLHAHSLSFIHPFTHEKLVLNDSFIGRFKKIFPQL